MYLITNAHIVNEGRIFKGAVLVKNDIIDSIFKGDVPESIREKAEVIDASDCWLMPGVIDDHVHFRDPGMTEKADFYTESRAAVAGGVTSVMDMPNTNPATISLASWNEKMAMIGEKSLVNYSCYLGATNNNLEDVLAADPTAVCGIKLFIGSSTGNLLVDDNNAMTAIFSKVKSLVAVHAEDNAIIANNVAKFKEQYGDDLPVSLHPQIRSHEACYKSTSWAVDLARKYGTRLHVMHISTENELALFEDKPLADKLITAETCPQYLIFDASDFETLGARIKCNPAIKNEADKKALLKAVASNKIDVIGTDHAPHLLSQKEGNALTAVSGMPGIQYSLPLMLSLAKQGVLSVEQVVEKMCHNPARLYRMEKRGFIRKGYKADLVVVRRSVPTNVTASDVLSKCGWSPYEGMTLPVSVAYTFVNGRPVYANGIINESTKGEALKFAIVSA
ncbi:MAG: dihydroorotase [Paludibacteraceae bacterium]|nr:dihydroorotase [Paludibacteraceae bacterium]